MDTKTEKKLKAAGKMALGAGRAIGGISTATGHGLIGGYLRQHHTISHAIYFGARSFQKGKELFEEGLADWKKSGS